ncbi:hypothetical protein [Cynomolgus macaque cytomegalovirus strain Mauritius]|uniref:Uncharacterized protein n=1 Tax=Cynomolgus macaque cytomegalovirus strain Mauritius TaxID=1690255 RepID=A0A0K1H0A6_9BETA|nr:hypothetical protein [Cynomolgus macaque cytomegalovirus strain Mauritius]AXG21788.1 hypothetical protein [synthetic construct]AXG22056.1 hypothetical protein [synthetic construct]
MSLSEQITEDAVCYADEQGAGDEFVAETVRSVFQMQRIRHGTGVSKVLRSERVTGGVKSVQEERTGYRLSVPQDLPGAGAPEPYTDFAVESVHGDDFEGSVRGYGAARPRSQGVLQEAGPGGVLPYSPSFRSVRSAPHGGAYVHGQRKVQRHASNAQRHRALPVQDELRIRDPVPGERAGGLLATPPAAASPVRSVAGSLPRGVRGGNNVRPMLRGADHHPQPGALAEQAPAGLALQPYCGPPAVEPVRCEYPNGGAGPHGADAAHPQPFWGPHGPQKPVLFFFGLPQLYPGGGGGAEGVQPVYGYTGTNIFLVGFYLLVPYLGGYSQAGGDKHAATKCLSSPVQSPHERPQQVPVRGGRGGHFRARGKAAFPRAASFRGVGLCRPQQDHRPNYIPQHSSFRGQPGFQQAPRKQRNVYQNQMPPGRDQAPRARWGGGGRGGGRGHSWAGPPEYVQ